MSETSPPPEKRPLRFTIIEAAGFISEQLNRLPGITSHADNQDWQSAVIHSVESLVNTLRTEFPRDMPKLVKHLAWHADRMQSEGQFRAEKQIRGLIEYLL